MNADDHDELVAMRAELDLLRRQLAELTAPKRCTKTWITNTDTTGVWSTVSEVRCSLDEGHHGAHLHHPAPGIPPSTPRRPWERSQIAHIIRGGL